MRPKSPVAKRKWRAALSADLRVSPFADQCCDICPVSPYAFFFPNREETTLLIVHHTTWSMELFWSIFFQYVLKTWLKNLLLATFQRVATHNKKKAKNMNGMSSVSAFNFVPLEWNAPPIRLVYDFPRQRFIFTPPVNECSAPKPRVCLNHSFQAFHREWSSFHHPWKCVKLKYSKTTDNGKTMTTALKYY